MYTNILTKKSVSFVRLYLYKIIYHICTYNNILDVQVPLPKDIYSRLKAVEDRVLLLERLSPLGKKYMP